MRKRPSIRRISAFTVILGLPVLVVIAGVMLPRFLTLESYRPIILSRLQEALDRRVTIGELQARLIPPAVTADNIVIFDPHFKDRPTLAAERIRFRLQVPALLRGKIKVHTAAFDRPRVILYTDQLTSTRTFPSVKSGESHASSLRILIHQGIIQVEGSLYDQKVQWTIDNVEAEVVGMPRHISLTARPTFLGPAARLRLTLDPGAQKPVHAELTRVTLDSVFSIFGSTRPAILRGAQMDARAEAAWPNTKNVVLHVDRFSVPTIPNAFVHGSLDIAAASVRGTLHFGGLSSKMMTQGQWTPRRNGWDLTATIDRYSPEIVRHVLKNHWAESLENPGSLKIRAAQRASRPLQFALSGSSFTFSGSRLVIPKWSASLEGPQLAVDVSAQTPDKEGQIIVHWGQELTGSTGRIQVSAKAIRVGDIFDVFAIKKSTSMGLDQWRIYEGEFQGVYHDSGRLVVNNASVILKDLTINTTGELELSARPPAARFRGQATDIDMSPVFERLGSRPAPIKGMAKAAFDVQFLTGSRWMESLNGQIEAEGENGFIRAGKVIYRIAGILNLNNLLKPTQREKTSEDGIPYKTIHAKANTVRGIMEFDDFMIHTSNMDITGKGQVSLPAETIDARIELQLLNVVKNTLNSIPIVKRVVSPDTGLVRIPVKIRGPLEDPEVN